MGLSENVSALATRTGQEFKSVRAALAKAVTLDTAQTVTGVKQYSPGTLNVRNADGSVVAEPYSILNPPPAGSSGIGLYELAADRQYSTTTYTDIPDWVIPLPANSVVTIDGILMFSSTATTTGFGFAATPRNVGNTAAIVPPRFIAVFEYQTSATAWATYTQNAPATPMPVTTGTYVANAAVVCRITGQIEMGATAGELHMQARSELALMNSITVRRGSPLRVM